MTESQILANLIRAGNWAGYHQRRAQSYREIAEGYRRSCHPDSHPKALVFAQERILDNELAAEQEEKLAKGGV